MRTSTEHRLMRPWPTSSCSTLSEDGGGRWKSTRGESEAQPSSAAASTPSASIPTVVVTGGRKSPVGHMVAELGRLLADLRGWDEEIEEDVLIIILDHPLELIVLDQYLFSLRRT
jgi:hypothetical protein